MASTAKRATPVEPEDVPQEEPQEEQAPAQPEAPRMWTEEELTHTAPDGTWAPALKEHWDTEEVTDNA